MTKFLIDTNVFYAVADGNDGTHPRAVEYMKKIKGTESYRVFIPAVVFEETLSLVSRKISKEAALNMLEIIEEDEKIEIAHTSQEQFVRAIEIFTAVVSKNFSFCDALTLTAAEEEGVDVIVSFDADLKKIKGPWKVWG